jgi:Tfp pilus assembly protein PilX
MKYLNQCRRQSGATLIVALIMLVMMTILAVSAINLSTINLRIVGNMQSQKAMDAAAQDAIEQVMSNYTLFTSPAATVVATPMGNVNVAQIICTSSNVAKGYTAVVTGVIPQDNIWEIKASITDSVTGAKTTLHEGVAIRMPAGNCPEPPTPLP